MNERSDRKVPLSLRDLFPHLSEKELAEVEETLHEYLSALWRIYDRISKDPVEYKKLKASLAERREMRKNKDKTP